MSFLQGLSMLFCTDIYVKEKFGCKAVCFCMGTVQLLGASVKLKIKGEK